MNLINYFIPKSSYLNLRLLVCLILLVFINLSSAQAVEKPLTTDNRIKTYIYNENEVFVVLVHYGYQSTIEFAKGEEVQTISLGDSYAWRVSPIGRRVFIKPLEENMHTNMSIITNKRIYHFDVVSKLSSDEGIDKELVYVIRFLYPEIEETEDLETQSN